MKSSVDKQHEEQVQWDTAVCDGCAQVRRHTGPYVCSSPPRTSKSKMAFTSDNVSQLHLFFAPLSAGFSVCVYSTYLTFLSMWY